MPIKILDIRIYILTFFSYVKRKETKKKWRFRGSSQMEVHDRPFHNLQASKSVDRQTQCYSETATSGFWGSKIVEGFVGLHDSSSCLINLLSSSKYQLDLLSSSLLTYFFLEVNKNSKLVVRIHTPKVVNRVSSKRVFFSKLFLIAFP